MALRSSGRRLSFEILSRSSNLEEEESLLLYRSQSDPIPGKYVVESLASSSREMPMGSRRKKKHKGSKRKRATELLKIPENDVLTENRAEDLNSVSTTANDSRIGENVLYENRSSYCGGGGGSLVTTVEEESVYQNAYNFGELRQRNVNSSGNVNVEDAMSESRFDNESRVEESVGEVSSTEKAPQLPQQWRSEQNGHVETKLETAGSLDWKRLMAEDPNYLFSEEKSPLKYFVEEMCNGNSLRSTTNLGTEKERERVYDTIFRLPWRCEALIDVGFFVCFDSFLSLLTIMPTRLAATVWRILIKRQFKRPSAAELSDFGCFLVLIVGVILLERTDISLIYHMIRGQGTIKLYVVYNVLEIFDKLCQNFCGDVLQTLFNSAEGVANCSHEKMRFWIWRFISDQALTMAASIFHSFILLAQAITLSTSIIAHNNALLALLVSNNFSEIKSNVFKRFSKDNIHSLAYADSIERFHISAFLLFVLAQNLLEAEGPWFESFLLNALMVFVCEMLIDIIKHSFLAKFNGIKPIAYSEFLEELCKQTLNIQSEAEKSLTFVPLAPACVAGCRILIKKKKPDWLTTLLRTNFFDSCIDHQDLRKNEKNVFCIDCNIGLCRHCLTAHCLHQRLQICKYVYQDVVRIQDMQKYLDCSKIQTYKINGEKAVHLNPRPQFKDSKPSTKSKTGGSCEACRRYIQDLPNRFCSIACKVSVLPVKPIDESKKMIFSIKELPDVSWKENYNHPEASTEEKVSSLSTIDFSDESDQAWMSSVLKPRRQIHKRKGIPRRSPLC